MYQLRTIKLNRTLLEIEAYLCTLIVAYDVSECKHHYHNRDGAVVIFIDYMNNTVFFDVNIIPLKINDIGMDNIRNIIKNFTSCLDYKICDISER